MPDRYFADSPIVSERATLSGPEAHHLAHVMRARAGDEVLLFDGSGAEFQARVERVGRSEIELAVVSRTEVDRELGFPLVLGVALPKGDRQRWLVEKATELGVTQLVPLATTRGVAQPVASAVARLRRAVVEASKQCGRNRLMEIAEPQELADYVTVGTVDALRLFAHPGGRPLDSIHRQWSTVPRGVHIAVGPEGGFTDEECVQAQDAGWQAVELGHRILRVETAAIMLAAVVGLWAQDKKRD